MAKDKIPSQGKNYGGKKRALIPDFVVSEWNGINTSIKDQTDLPIGASPDALNWITGKYKDHIELRRGYALLGNTRVSNAGKITGIGIGTRPDGTQIPFFTYAQKIKYYNATTQDTAEIGTNTLPATANGEDVAIMPYQNLAGASTYITSPSSSIYKIMNANPASITDLMSLAFRGKAKIDTNRMFLWDRRDVQLSRYQTELYLSLSDQTSISQYTQTVAESAGTGDGATKAFSGTLAFKASNPKQTTFFNEFFSPVFAGVSITGITNAVQAVVTVGSHSLQTGDIVFFDGVSGMTQINDTFGVVESTTATTITTSINSTTYGVYSSGGSIYKSEYFHDDKNGNLTSNLGGTGTINYTTGAYVLNFNTAPLNGKGIFSNYYVEDSTNGGIADFTIDGSTTGKGKIFPQFDGGGNLNAVLPFDQTQYCFHVVKTWYLSLGTDDTKAANLPYRSQFGIPYWRAAFATPDGIVMIDNALPSNPKAKILEIDASLSTAVLTIVPVTISDQLDLTPFGFNAAVVRRWGDYDIIACQNVVNGVVDSFNTIFFLRNIYSGQWDRLDYMVSCLDEFYGALLGGSSLQNNVFTLFSGTDDDGSKINNYWTSKQFDLHVEGTKKFNRFVIRGLIQNTQNLDIMLSFDSGAFIKIFTVQGNASYVNQGNPVFVGSNTVGSQVVGGGNGQGPAITAYPFEVELEFSSDYFEYVQAKFVANNIGFIQIDEYIFKDIRYKGRKLPAARVISTT